MNTIVSDFITMENLERKPRVSRCQRARASSIKSKPLHIIVEESECYASQPAPALKARRRHCNLSPSEIQIARDFVGIGDEDDVSDLKDRLMLVPPSSARFQRGSSPVPSPDSFQLEFTDGSITFPHPPIPTPTSLTSRHIQSFCGPSTSTQPLTPTSSESSDDEFFSLPSPKFNPRRAAIQPLTIRKHLSLSAAPTPKCEFPAPTNPTQFALSPFTSEESSSSSDSESDAGESDSEWYQRELSSILTVRQPTTSPSAAHKPRPDSIFISHPPSKRISRPSGQLDPAFPQRRASRQIHIPSYPPPPVPSIPVHLRPVSHLVPSSPISPPSSRLSFALGSPSRSPIRPPPRSSVPADFEFDDDESAFSFGLYEYDEEEGFSQPPTSFHSMFELSSSASSSPLDDVEFDIDIDYQMMLPLSIPGTPTDLESDIATGLEELRAGRNAISSPTPSTSSSQHYSRPLPPLPSVPEDHEDTISEFSFPPSIIHADPFLSRTPSRSSFDSFYVYTPPASPRPAPSPPATPARFTIEDEERVLKSKWSSSTLGSIREEHERRISSRLRLFSPSKKSRRSGSTSKSPSPPAVKSSSPVPSAPMSPMSFLSPSKKHHHQKTSSGAGLFSKSHKRESEVMPGVRRRGSCTTVSDAGSEESSSSSTSSGLRRKPIPLELFMRV